MRNFLNNIYLKLLKLIEFIPDNIYIEGASEFESFLKFEMRSNITLSCPILPCISRFLICFFIFSFLTHKIVKKIYFSIT